MREIETTKENEVLKGTASNLSRLILEQGVSPIDDLEQLGALWPADDDPDALMNYVLSERQARVQIDAEDRKAK